MRVVGWTLRESGVTNERDALEVQIAVDAADVGAALAHLTQVLAEHPDVPPVDVVDVAETADPRALSQQTQDLLRCAADELRDELGEDFEMVRARGTFEQTRAVQRYLPGTFAHHYTPNLVAQWARSVEAVALKLAAFPDTYLATTAEELAGHALIERCRELLEEREAGVEDPEAVHEKLSEVHDLAFEDHDVLRLFDPSFDGIDASDLGQQLGVANLHPKDWFKPFRMDGTTPPRPSWERHIAISSRTPIL